MEHQKGQDRGGGLKLKTYWVLAGFLAIGAFFLLTEHRALLLGFLPFLAVLACPLMHLFHHHGHGSHREHELGLRQPRDGDQGERK